MDKIGSSMPCANKGEGNWGRKTDKGEREREISGEKETFNKRFTNSGDKFINIIIILIGNFDPKYRDWNQRPWGYSSSLCHFSHPLELGDQYNYNYKNLDPGHFWSLNCNQVDTIFWIEIYVGQ